MGHDIVLAPVTSRCIAAAGYAPEAAILRLRFVGGGTYDYGGVPDVVYAAFETAPSKGRFVNHVIKPHFPCRRVMVTGSGGDGVG